MSRKGGKFTYACGNLLCEIVNATVGRTVQNRKRLKLRKHNLENQLMCTNRPFGTEVLRRLGDHRKSMRASIYIYLAPSVLRRMKLTDKFISILFISYASVIV